VRQDAIGTLDLFYENAVNLRPKIRTIAAPKLTIDLKKRLLVQPILIVPSHSVRV
jgi:hypothetical protein